MKIHLTLLVLIFNSLLAYPQIKMRSLDELINKADPGWVFVKQWIDSAKNKIEVLPVNAENATDALYKMQVTTRSPMGAIVYMTGGILVDNGWIRILGSGSTKLPRTLPDWNKGKAIEEFGQGSPFLLIADDAMGGFFLLNGGEFGEDIGKVYYFAPDNLEFEPLGISYSDFLEFCFSGNLEEFYEGYRWKNWEQEVSDLAGDRVYSFFPCLWTTENKDMDKISRKNVPVEEQYHLNLNFRKQLGFD
jgi:hypothetical protein